jgi:hypothetical protein
MSDTRKNYAAFLRKPLVNQRNATTVSGKCSQEHIHGMLHVFSGGLNDLLVPLQLQVAVFFKLLDAPHVQK